MDLTFDVKMKKGWKTDPVVHYQHCTIPDTVKIPQEEGLLKIFKTDAYKLQTWGRAKSLDGKIIRENDPHWIGVRGSTPLHVDPAYPRYSHQLKVRVDPNISIRGHAKVEHQLERGVFYILDTHSPHQVWAPDGGWNVSVSVDSKTPLDPATTIQRCMLYALANEIE